VTFIFARTRRPFGKLRAQGDYCRNHRGFDLRDFSQILRQNHKGFCPTSLSSKPQGFRPTSLS